MPQASGCCTAYPGDRRRSAQTGAARRALCALCLWPLVLLGACSKTPPALPSAAPVDPVQRLHRDVVAAIEQPGVQRGTWGIVVHSLARDERLIDLQADDLFVPASAAKLVTAATAAEAVGWDYQYETTLRATGSVVGDTLEGDLLVVGSGDPTIGGRGGTDLEPWVEALEALGVRRVEGRVIADDDAVEEPRPQLAWAWDDLGYATGAIFGALNFGENRMAVMVHAGAVAGAPTTLTVEPHAPTRPLTNRTVTSPPGSRQLLWPEQRPGETSLTIAGSIPAGAGPARVTVAVGNPTLWFARALRSELLKKGIVVTGEAVDVDDLWVRPDPEASPILHTHLSPPLSAIVRPLLKNSINLYGEALMRLNAAPGAFPTNDAALEGLRTRLEAWGVPPDAQQLVDGSGLSRRNTIAPEALLTVLRRMHALDAAPFVSALPVAGVDGSLAGRMIGTAAQGNVRAKTGTMTNIRSLAGYVTTRDGEPLAFVILVNNFEGPGTIAVQAIDAIAVKLAEFTRSPPGGRVPLE